MCGRYDLNQHPAVIQLQFSLGLVPPFEPRYNIAPSQVAPVVRLTRSGERECAWLRWGLIPYWAKDEKIGYRTINARSETVARAPAFRAAYERRRCIVPASGFFEWRVLERSKRPYRITPADTELFGFAGLWERWKAPGGQTLETYTILTTAANALIRKLHDRMPVILAPEDYGTWLDVGNREPGTVLRAYPPERMRAYPVSTRVNSPKNDDPNCIEPLVETQ